jgi:hypothetical protein
MSDLTPWSIAGAILSSLGGGALIVAVLFKWLGDLTAKRILQREQNAVLVSLEGLKQELGLARLSYDKHVQHVVDYYAMFYKSYQLCQRTAHFDLIRHPDRPDLDTKKDYLDRIDDIADEWNNRQGLVRLVLPRKALELHEQALAELNTFKDFVKRFNRNSEKSRDNLRDSFHRIDAIKTSLEGCLREHLRTDKI